MTKRLRGIRLAMSLMMTACGYQWQPDFPEGLRPTVSIPFVQGDEDGTFTAEVIQAMSTSGIADVRSQGEYTLRISIVGEGTEQIGYRTDPQKVDGKVRKNLLACEARRSMTIDATLYLKEKMIRGPYRLSACAEYDYVDGDSIQDLTFVNSTGAVVTVLPFSLGQLESAESASWAATQPLYRKLAQKVVDTISSEW